MKTLLLVLAIVAVAVGAYAQQLQLLPSGSVRCTAERVEAAAAVNNDPASLVDQVLDRLNNDEFLTFCAVAISDAPGRGLLPFLPWKKRSVAELPWGGAQPPIITVFSEERGLLGGWNLSNDPDHYLVVEDRASLRLLDVLSSMERAVGDAAHFYAITAMP